MDESRSQLITEIAELAKLFTEDHNCFRITNPNPDELSFTFIAGSEKFYDFKVNIEENYPVTPAVWTTQADSDEMSIIKSLPMANNSTLTHQIDFLIRELCRNNSLPLPETCDKLAILQRSITDKSNAPKPKAENVETPKSEADVEQEQQKSLEKLSEMHLKKNPQASTMGTRRLKNELLKIWRCESYKNKHFTVDLENDSLHEWNVRLLLPAIDPDSPLHKDLVQLKQLTGCEGILLHILFKERYPFDPPFVRVVEPVIKKGHVFEFGGVMCMELLMPEYWVPAYTVEGIILQVAATLVRGAGRVNFGASKEEYTLEKAQKGLQMLERMPDRSRWTSKFEDG